MNASTVLLHALLLGTVASVLPTQRTWLVDCAGRPWSDFSDLPAAIAASAPGDTIVLYGDFMCGQPFTAVVIDKPLRIVGTSPGGAIGYPAGANVLGRLEIRNIPAGSQVVLSHLWFASSGLLTVPPFVAPHGIDVRNCAGRVVLDHVDYQGAGRVNGMLLFEDCSDVILDTCGFAGTGMPATFRRSRCQMTASGMAPAARGPMPLWVVQQTFEGMYIEDSDVTMIASGVAGAREENFPPQPFMPARSAVILQSGYLRLGPGSTLTGGYEPDPYSQLPGGLRSVAAIITSIPSHVLIDPRAQAGSNNWGIPNPTFQYLHGIDHTHVTQNEQFSVRVMGPPGGFMLLVLGNSINPWVQSGIGLLGVDPSSLTVLGCAALAPGSGSATQTFSVWRSIPIDTVFAFQAALLNPAGAISLTRPTPFTVGWMAGRTMP